jgi:hypothetical protein
MTDDDDMKATDSGGTEAYYSCAALQRGQAGLAFAVFEMPPACHAYPRLEVSVNLVSSARSRLTPLWVPCGCHPGSPHAPEHGSLVGPWPAKGI